MIGWAPDTVQVISTASMHTINIALTAYIVRILSKEVFRYLNHRLDVLGKDAFLFFPQDRYDQGPDGRVTPRDPQVRDKDKPTQQRDAARAETEFARKPACDLAQENITYQDANLTLRDIDEWAGEWRADRDELEHGRGDGRRNLGTNGFDQ